MITYHFILQYLYSSRLILHTYFHLLNFSHETVFQSFSSGDTTSGYQCFQYYDNSCNELSLNFIIFDMSHSKLDGKLALYFYEEKAKDLTTGFRWLAFLLKKKIGFSMSVSVSFWICNILWKHSSVFVIIS